MLKYFIPLLLLGLPALSSARWIEDIVRLDNAATGTVEFSHYQHLDAVGNDCALCHNRVFHIISKNNPPASMADMERGKSCGACHNDKKAFSVKSNCANCHPTGEVNFNTEAGDVLFSHQLHIEMYSCSDCHPDLFTPKAGHTRGISMQQMEAGTSCGACHDGNSAFSVEADCETCHDM